MHEPSLDDQARRQKNEELRILKHAALHTLQEDLFQYVLERSITETGLSRSSAFQSPSHSIPSQSTMAINAKFCRHCLDVYPLARPAARRAKPLYTQQIPFHTTTIIHNSSTNDTLSSDPSADIRQTSAQARARAWYLDPSESPSPTYPPRPRFTTFDPTRTTSTPSARRSRSLPSSAPPYLQSLHAFLTGPEAAEVLDPASVVFIDCATADPRKVGEGEVIRGSSGVGGRWEWLVVLEVKGTGKGIMGRAERMLRLWASSSLSIYA